MSDDIIARRARALEALLSPAMAGGRPVRDVPAPPAARDAATAEPATAEPAATAGGGEPAGPDADEPETAGPDASETETPAVDELREAMMVARIGALLGHPGTWQAPATSATLPEALLAEVRKPVAASAASDAAKADAATPEPAEPEPAKPVPATAPRRRWWPQLRWTPPRLALGIAGGLAALLLVVVMFGGDFLNGQTGPVVQLAGTSAAPQAHAELRASERDAGWRLVVDIKGLAPAGPDEYYQGWAVHDQEMVPLGTFHMHKQGQVELWSGVPLKKFSRIEVTAQRVGAGQVPGVLVMVGQM